MHEIEEKQAPIHPDSVETQHEASLQALDARLAELARGSGRARLVIGELLEALARRGGHHELGFSSFEAYARERAGRSGRWAVESRTLARRLVRLPRLRTALASGALGWCMAELVARQAEPDTEAVLVAEALRSTVRSMRALLTPGQVSAGDDDDEPEHRCLALTLSREDAWLFEWTRRFAEHTGSEPGADGTLSALLAEALSSLCWELPANDLERCVQPGDDTAAARERREVLALRRAASERRCESSLEARGPGGGGELIPLPALGALGSRGLDERIVGLCREYSAAELELARTALAFHQAEGARRLGYATEAQYARERLGISHSSFKAKLALARRSVPRVAAALEQREIGHEAALLISRVARADTAEAWVARARERTVKHLAEEVRAAELMHTLGAPIAPPTAETVRKLHELEGRLLAGDRETVLTDGRQMSARLAPRSGKVVMRLRVSCDTARFYRGLEAAVKPHLPSGISFTRLLCDRFWQAWKHLAKRDEAHARIYIRDRFTCTSPVCSRHDVTPHHVKFRSLGGSDEDENVIALCTWCHLEGVHGGRIEVAGKAGDLRWTFAAQRVDGRTVHSPSRRIPCG